MNSAAHFVGYLVMIACGLLLAAALVAASAVAVGVAGAWLWKRLRRIYHLSVIWYWLERLEKEGTHCFQKANAAPTQAPAIQDAQDKDGTR